MLTFTPTNPLKATRPSRSTITPGGIYRVRHPQSGATDLCYVTRVKPGGDHVEISKPSYATRPGKNGHNERGWTKPRSVPVEFIQQPEHHDAGAMAAYVTDLGPCPHL